MACASSAAVCASIGCAQMAGRRCATLKRSPWYAATATVVVALSFALATTVFALVDGVLFKPLPYRAPDQLFVVSPWFTALSNHVVVGSSAPDVRAWVAAVPEAQFATFSLGGCTTIADQETLRSAEIDAAFLGRSGCSTLARRLRRGRLRAVYADPAGTVVVRDLAEPLWRRSERRRTDVHGSTRRRHSSGGRAQEGIRVPAPGRTGRRRRCSCRSNGAAMAGTTSSTRAACWYWRGCRRQRRRTFESRLTAATIATARSFPPLPPAPPGMSEIRKITRGPFDIVKALPLSDVMVEQTHAVSTAIFAIAGALVVLASLNLAGLTAGRALDRRRELSLRRALGGSGLALARLLLVENAIVIGAGAITGIVAARWLLNVAMTLMPPSLLLLKPSTIDWRVVVFVALAATVALAIVTAWSVYVALRTSTRGSVAGAAGTTENTRSMGRSWLIAGEVAIALVMAVSAALVSASLVRVWQEPSGFRIDDRRRCSWRCRAILALSTSRPSWTAWKKCRASTPSAVSAIRFLQNASMGSFFEPPPGITSGETEHVYSTAGIFRALGLTLRAGAWPEPRVFDQQPVVVVSQDVADRFWPGQPAVGQQLLRKGKAFDVVGVVADARFQALDRDPMGSIYASVAHLDSPSIVNVIVAFDGDPARGLDAVVAAMRTNYPEIRIRTARTMVDALGASASVQRRTFQTWLFRRSVWPASSSPASACSDRSRWRRAAAPERWACAWRSARPAPVSST
jgi:hypothetical protein